MIQRAVGDSVDATAVVLIFIFGILIVMDFRMNASCSVSDGLELPDDIVVSVLSSSVISEKHSFHLSHGTAVTGLKQYLLTPG